MSRNSDRGLIILFLHLEQLEKAGVPISQSLAEAAKETPERKLRGALEGIAQQVGQGHSLQESMGFYPRAFDETLIGLVGVGEKSGKLARAFGLCLDYVRKRDEHRRLMRKALRGPTISVITILALALVRRHTLLPDVALASALLIAAFIALRRWLEVFRHVTDRLFLALPVVGTFLSEDSWARFANSLAMLFDAGVPLRAALKTAAEDVPNLVVRASVEEALPQIEAGASLHAAFRETGRMDKMALAMMKAGEDTGNLGHTLRELAEFYEKRCADALTALQQVSGPVLTIITGAYLYLGF